MEIKTTEKARLYAKTHTLEETCEVITNETKRKETELSLMDIICLSDMVCLYRMLVSFIEQAESKPREELDSETEKEITDEKGKGNEY